MCSDTDDIVFDENYQLPAGYKQMPVAHRKALNANGLKRCSSCYSTKKLEAFGACASRPDGLAPECKQCRATTKRAKVEARYAALGRSAPPLAKAKKRAKFAKPFREDDFALIVPDLIAKARREGHPAFEDASLRGTAAAREVITERPDLVVFCTWSGEWYPATHAEMVVSWSKECFKPCLVSNTRSANSALLAQRSQEARAMHAAGETVTPDHKWCPSCSQTLPAEAFGVHRQNKDGLNAYCKSCDADRVTNREYAKKHQTPEHLKEATASAWSLLSHVARVGEFLTGKKYHRDHLVAISKAVEGQTFLHQPSNLRLMEAASNIAKNDRPPTEAELQEARFNVAGGIIAEYEWSTADGLFMGTGEIELSDLYDDDCL